MKPQVNCITLPVDDLSQALRFYRDGLGWTTDGFSETPGAGDHIVFTLRHGLYLVLIRRTGFTVAGDMAPRTDDHKGAPDTILSYFAETKDEVDQALQQATAFGGKVGAAPQMGEWGYSGYFTDPDGHLWEVAWNPELTGSSIESSVTVSPAATG